MHRRPGEKRDNWLLIKQQDDAARNARDKDILEQKAALGENRPLAWTRSPKARRRRRNRGQRQSKTARNANRPASAPRRPACKNAPDAASKARQRRSRNDRPCARAAPCRISSRLALPRSSDKAPESDNWIHEIKFDGYRLQARLDGRQGETADAARPRLDAEVSRHCRSHRQAAGQGRADRRRTGGGRRGRRLQLLAAAASSEIRPRHAACCFTSSICCISTATTCGLCRLHARKAALAKLLDARRRRSLCA